METGEGEGGDDGESKRVKGITCTLYMLMLTHPVVHISRNERS